MKVKVQDIIVRNNQSGFLSFNFNLAFHLPKDFVVIYHREDIFALTIFDKESYIRVEIVDSYHGLVLLLYVNHNNIKSLAGKYEDIKDVVIISGRRVVLNA